MDHYSKVREVETRLDRLDGMRITDDQSARGALAYVLVTVSYMNQISTQADTTPALRAEGSTVNVLKKLEEWLERLVSALTRIVKHAKAASFSISVGTNVSVTVGFGPFADTSV